MYPYNKRAINVYCYYTEITHTTTNVFLTNLTFYSICVIVYLKVAMAARGSGIHDIYFPGARCLRIYEVLSS